MRGGLLRAVADAVTIARLHIVLIAMAATVVFGWLMTGRYLVAVALVAGVDWFVINLANRITDIREDLRNGIPGTERVARDKRAFAAIAWVALALSLAACAVVWPALLPARLLVQAVGLGYNYRVVPTPRGWSRFKELYFFKNFMSATLFVLTGFAYPLLVAPRVMPWPAIAVLCAFFVAFELSYEILYDFRDLQGDREHAIPTYPVVHGPRTARRLMNGLLALSAAVLLAGLVLRWIGVREALMIAAPALQAALAYAWLNRGLQRRDCIALTHLGTVLLLVFLAGTAVWLRLGLPANVWL